jgi:hypothetical protein
VLDVARVNAFIALAFTKLQRSEVIRVPFDRI